MHGDADEHVPVELSRRYANGGHAVYVELVGCGHMEFLDPASEAGPPQRQLAGAPARLSAVDRVRAASVRALRARGRRSASACSSTAATITEPPTIVRVSGSSR